MGAHESYSPQGDAKDGDLILSVSMRNLCVGGLRFNSKRGQKKRQAPLRKKRAARTLVDPPAAP
jgi:hypothetical protein